MKYYILALLFLLLAWYVVEEEQEIPIEMEIKNVAANLIKNVATGEVNLSTKPSKPLKFSIYKENVKLQQNCILM
jgi:hypothetical protein